VADRSLREIEAKARASRQEKLLGEVSALLNSVRIHNTWRSTAVLIYRNWLEHLCTQKRHGGYPVVASAGTGAAVAVPQCGQLKW
jgi:hypothetical protein